MFRKATPARRLGGYILDGITWSLIFFFFSLSSKDGAPIAFLASVLFTGYFWSQGSSPGKMVLCMRVINKDTKEPVGFWTMLLRETIGKAISGFIFAIGYLWILFDSDNQGWHDKLVNTVVVSTE